MAYKIHISEQQRAILQRALACYCAGHVANEELPPDDYAESVMLHKHFKDLPEAEMEMQTKYGHAAGTSLHGFCL